jgi:RNA polymerase sigma-70 factor (ECF subfamily)
MRRELGERFFRHEYSRLVAVLARRVGMHHLETVEDAVQCALLAAVESWGRAGVPESPWWSATPCWSGSRPPRSTR